MSALSERLRELADEVEDTEIDDDRHAHFVIRMELTEDLMWDSFAKSDVSWDNVQFGDPYDGSFQVSMFL